MVKGTRVTGLGLASGILREGVLVKEFDPYAPATLIECRDEHTSSIMRFVVTASVKRVEND